MDALRWFRRAEGWTDPGERAAVQQVAAEARGRPILDLGVGGGRTVSLLRAISDDYTAIDYTAELVAVCRRRHPGVRILAMDARDLGTFADRSFFLATFSYNGIDAVDYGGRLQILREVHRVLEDGGAFVVSMHNSDGPEHTSRFRLPLPPLKRNPIRLGLQLINVARRVPIALYNHRRHRHRNQRFATHDLVNAAAHDFGIVIVMTTLTEQKRELENAGFVVEAVFDNVQGRPVTDQDDTSAIGYFQIIARKPSPARPMASG